MEDEGARRAALEWGYEIEKPGHEQVYDFLVKWWSNPVGDPPCLEDIATGLSLHRSSVVAACKKLAKDGRALRTVSKAKKTIWIPIRKNSSKG